MPITYLDVSRSGDSRDGMGAPRGAVMRRWYIQVDSEWLNLEGAAAWDGKVCM